MVDEKSIVPVGKIENRILLVRGEKVIIDADLAEFYGVATKRLNEQVKRNANRFPGDFMFQLTKEEKSEVVANCDHLSKLKYSPSLPYAFTEHGAIMAASVLNSQRAVEISVFIVRAFVQIRHFVIDHAELKREVDELRRQTEERFQVVFTVLDQLVSDEGDGTDRRIGFIEKK